MTTIQDDLFAMQDLGYRDFHAKLIPNINKDTIIGVRTPHLRAYAKKRLQAQDYELFLNELPHTYYEENNLHGMLIEKGKDFEKVVSELNGFLPYIDNWATCDMISPKVFKKHLQELLPQIDVSQAAALASTKACRPNWRFPAWWSICSSTAQSGRSNGSRFSAAMSTLTTQALDGSVSHVSLPSHGRNFSVNCGFSRTWAVLPRLRSSYAPCPVLLPSDHCHP